jgi:hypothetical protein
MGAFERDRLSNSNLENILQRSALSRGGPKLPIHTLVNGNLFPSRLDEQSLHDTLGHLEIEPIFEECFQGWKVSSKDLNSLQVELEGGRLFPNFSEGTR